MRLSTRISCTSVGPEPSTPHQLERHRLLQPAPHPLQIPPRASTQEVIAVDGAPQDTRLVQAGTSMGATSHEPRRLQLRGRVCFQEGWGITSPV